jgi:hypothetical protein
MVISEIMDLPAAFDYAADLTIKQGGRAMAAFGWEGQDQTALGDACHRAGVHLVADNLREHAAGLHTALTLAGWGIAATGLVGEEGASLRWTFLHSAAICAIIAVLTLLLTYWFQFMLP